MRETRSGEQKTLTALLCGEKSRKTSGTRVIVYLICRILFTELRNGRRILVKFYFKKPWRATQFSFMKESVARVEKWEAITEKLNQVKTPFRPAVILMIN